MPISENIPTQPTKDHEPTTPKATLQTLLNRIQFVSVSDGNIVVQFSDQPKPPEVTVLPMKDRTYLKSGCVDAFVRVLPEPEVFSTKANYTHKGRPIPATAPVLALEDIAPFGFKERIPADQTIRNLAKLLMTRDFLAVVWAADELEPKWEVCYGFTNATMAKFKAKHWGFEVLDERHAEDLQQSVPPLHGYPQVVTREKLEEMYPHILTYVLELVGRLK